MIALPMPGLQQCQGLLLGDQQAAHFVQKPWMAAELVHRRWHCAHCSLQGWHFGAWLAQNRIALLSGVSLQAGTTR